MAKAGLVHIHFVQGAMKSMPIPRRCFTAGALLMILSSVALPQTSDPPPVQLTADQDHQNMMDQLGIKALRPGPSGDEHASNHANYDEALATPYPHLPDVLRSKNGTTVTTSRQWWTERRPQIVEDISREVYGFVPENVPEVTWAVVASEREMVGAFPVIAKQLVGHVDNSSYPLIDVNLSMTLVVPAEIKKPVPVLMMFRRTGLPSPQPPPQGDVDRVDQVLKAMLEARDPGLADVFAQYPGYSVVPAPPTPHFGPAPPEFGVRPGDLPPTQELLKAGWGFAFFDPASVQADNGEGLTRGIIGLVNKGQPRKPDQWGALRAWSWGAGRALDYLETDSDVDAKHVGIEGVSRYGKAALVTLAFDQRFAMGLIGSSGEGGAKLNRRNFGESVASLATGEYYWMAGNFIKYDASDAVFGSKTPNDLPVDSHELIALCAPRLTFISYGIPEQGDAKWLDQKGSFMATVAAQPVFRLLGAGDLGVPDDYNQVTLPPVNHGLLSGHLAWRQDDGGHTDAPNVQTFIDWADKFIDYERKEVTTSN